MMGRLRHVLASAVFLYLGLAIAVVNREPTTSAVLSNASISTSTTVPTAIPTAVPHDRYETVPVVSLPNVTDPGLVQVASGRDNVPDEWRMAEKKWQGKATVEVYMLSDVMNTSGNLTGPLLYGAIWQTLNNNCPDRIGINDNPPCYDGYTPIWIRYKSGDKGQYSATYLQLRIIDSKFGTGAARKPLFGALAAAYEAMTYNDMNCFTVKDDEYGDRYCNVAYQASVFTEDSHIYISLTSDTRDDTSNGDWKCCETREFVDTELDRGDVRSFKDIYPTKRNKDRLVGCHMGCTDDQRVSTMDVDKRLAHIIDHEFF